MGKNRLAESLLALCLFVASCAITEERGSSAPAVPRSGAAPAHAYVPDAAVTAGLRTSEARRILTATLPKNSLISRGARFDYPTKIDFEGDRLIVAVEDLREPLVFSFDQLSGFQVAPRSFWDQGNTVKLGKGLTIHVRTRLGIEAAKKVADALFVLKTRVYPAHDPSEEATFQAAARAYLGSPSKPAFPEEARRTRVQAEAAVRDKQSRMRPTFTPTPCAPCHGGPKGDSIAP